MKDQNLPGGSAGILARLLAAIALPLVVFAANASSGDDMCFSLYAKSGAARSTKACRLDVVGNTPGGMGNYACINNLELIDQWCAGADADQPEKSCPVADPVYPGSGAVTLSETDFVSGDDIPLQLTRTYRSTPLAKNVSAMGPVWFHSWQRSLGLANANSGGSSKVLAYRENGEPVTFNWSAGTWRTAAFSGLALAQNGTGLSKLSRAWDKHSPREPGYYPPLTGNIDAKNATTEAWLRDLLQNPTTEKVSLGRGGVEYRAADGTGARWNSDGQFSGVLNPRRN